MATYKGVEIDLVPTDAMAEVAARALDWREEFGRGGTEVGVARARDISNKRELSPETIGRMVSYFARHEVDKQAEGFNQGEEGFPSAGRIAWDLWGGDVGQSWANRKMEQMDNIDEEDRSMERPYPNEHAARLTDPDQYDEFRREENAGGDGIDFIYGIKDGKSEIQAIRFDKNLYSVEDAKKWLANNEFEPILFEPASEERMEENKEVTVEPTEQVEEVRAEEVAQAEETRAEEVAAIEEVEIPVEAERKQEKLTTRADAMEAVVEDDRRVRMAISSEQPVDRSFGVEILDHNPESIDLSFLNSGRAPLLLDHDPEKQIGVIESVSLDGTSRKLRAVVRFGRSGQASEVYDDVVDNIRGNVSIGYQIKKMARDQNDKNVYRATSWMPLEASIVSIPADVTVGVGRSVEPSNLEPVVEAEQTRSEDTAKPLYLEKKMENVEIKVEEQRAAFDKPIQADIGMSKPEVKRYSLLRAINALANPTDRQAQRAAAFELECSEAAQRSFGQSAQGLLVPAEVLRSWGKRDLNTTDDAGFVGQDFRSGDFIDALRNASSVMQAGATMLTGLQGNVKIPKKTAASSGGWINGEGTAASESEMTVGSVTMTPKTVGAFTDISRQMMIQSTLDIEALVRQDLTDSIALAIDLGALAGTGSSGQPTGIKATSGINNPTDFAAAIPTWAEVVAMETAVAEDNALRGNLAYILPASMYGALKTTAKDSGSGQFVVSPDGTINGYRAIVSNQVTAGDLYFGNFADLLIGLFGGLDIVVDPYTASSSGTVRVVALQSVDVAVRNAVSFAFNNDGV